MTGLVQHQAPVRLRAELRNDTLKIHRELGLREQQFEFAERIHSRRNLYRVNAQQFGQLPQDAMNFAQLLFPQSHQLVIEIDGLERLDKQRVTAAARAVDDAL